MSESRTSIQTEGLKDAGLLAGLPGRSRFWDQYGASAGASAFKQTIRPHWAGPARSRPSGAGGDDAMHRRQVEEFVALLFDEAGSDCERYLQAFVARSGDPQHAAAYLLGPAARLVGDYWRMDICDFMKVTVVMTRIHRMFWSIASEFSPPPPRPDRAVLLAPVPGDQHSFGLAVVEDAFRRAGWTVDGCSFDEERQLLSLAAANDYQVIGLSMSGEVFAPLLAETVGRLRRASRNRATRIMAGGSIFVEKPELASVVGCDFIATDALSAIDIAEGLAASEDCGEARQMSVAAE